MSSSQYHGTNTTSSLRPRNKRLISVEDGDVLTQQSLNLPSGPKTAPIAALETSASASGSRNASPSSYSFGTRAASYGNGSRVDGSQTYTAGDTKKWNLGVSSPKSATFLFSPKYWGESWSSIQGVASTFLGTDLRASPRSATLPRSYNASARYGAAKDDEWGPTINIETHLAAGSQEDRLNQIQARKRQALLTANGHNKSDARGKYKRKLSIDDTQAVVTEQSEDALVYVHIVQSSDTVMGLAIKYGCSEAVVRKTNRLWANDSLQLKRLAYIPVDSCTVKGQKLETPLKPPQSEVNHEVQNAHQLSPRSPMDWSIPTTPKPSQNTFSVPSPSLTATTTSYDTTTPHIHESWVQITGFTTSTEIARLPRRALGFFPPARRKSISYHDATPSGASSPILSASTSPPSSVSALNAASLLPPISHRSQRPRATSSLMSPNTIAAALRGPGGVGTLGTEARAPGPAQDKLNDFFAAHFPNAAIPIVPPSNPPSRRISFDSLRSGMSTPNGSGGLEQIGGKVETWVRKLAAKGAKDPVVGHSGTQGGLRGSAAQLINSEVQGDGDLIEMMDGLDLLGNDDVHSVPASKGISTGTGDSDALRERFPVGGRVFESVRK